MPGPLGVPRTDIIALLAEGHSNNEIGRRLRTNPHRVARIRAEYGIPRYEPRTQLTLEQKWRASTRRDADGHLRWTGTFRGSTANLVYLQTNYSARRVAFAMAQGREPVGRVLSSCGHPWCVAPEHATDAPMRRADNAYTRIFGRAA